MKFDEKSVIRAHAMAVLADPASTEEDRLAARAALMRAPLDVRALSGAERAELRRLLAKARGEDDRGAPLPMDASARRGRAQSEALDAIRAAELASARCAQIWEETGGPRWTPPHPRWLTVGDHLAAIRELDPNGVQIRAWASSDDQAAEQVGSGAEQVRGSIP